NYFLYSTMVEKRKILWVDDEIHLLKPHILFLQGKGYEVLTATNGIDALEIVKNTILQAVLLDEMMAGLDGLAVLERIKGIKPNLPVIMITKSEEESLMEDAIGRKITDYLIKPVNPSQVLMILKKTLEKGDITREAFSVNYMSFYQEISRDILNGIPILKHWIDTYAAMTRWEVEFDRNQHDDLMELFFDQKKQLNQLFERFIIDNYKEIIHSSKQEVCDSAGVLDRFITPRLEKSEKVLFILIDCMRYDQWLMIAPLIQDYFHIDMHQHLSILPTATPYSRNAIFSGMYPDEIDKVFPEIYKNADLDDSMNRFEGELLSRYIEKAGLTLTGGMKYLKILDSRQGEHITQHFSDYKSNQFISLVINFVDIVAHRRSESQLLQEI
ncbi:MAG: bifunctional response regulator/alkaline phosphatase family protein, partial [Candidatus Marinimicrobia bacterium]|nr:bifunctional response regulator/alkaline phosphatase family protein [Candidatus Neomarinimicrobiota bacterium]